MAYLALYRAWRPQKFKDVIGQDHITKTLKNALKQNRFSHAYLFNGPRGCGKTSVAKIFAKAINCEHRENGEPCNECSSCKGITKGIILDVVEIDAASNRGVDEIREIRENVKFTPTETEYKVYIIDEVHMLTTEAFNALLKTLEEPPEHAIFILATTEPHKIPLTIVSRCQRFDFKRIPAEIMKESLNYIANSEGYDVEEQALSLIAKYSEGAMRDALSLLDQVFSSSGKNININDILNLTGRVSNQTFSSITKLISEGKTVEVLNEVTALLYEGKESQKILEDLVYYYRDLLLYKSAPSLDEMKEKVILVKDFATVANNYSEERLYIIIETLNKYLNEMKFSNQNRIILELSLIKITRMFSKTQETEATTNNEIEYLQDKIRGLEVIVEELRNSNMKKKDKKEIQPVKMKTGIDEKLKLINENSSEDNLQVVLKAWPDILQKVKQKKVTVHAWFLDGEPVSVTKDIIIVAFNNVMHRDTTNKEQNLKLIEEVIYEQLGTKYHLFNTMQKEWNQFIEKENKTEKQELESDNTDTIINNTTELFGKDLLIIKD